MLNYLTFWSTALNVQSACRIADADNNEVVNAGHWSTNISAAEPWGDRHPHESNPNHFLFNFSFGSNKSKTAKQTRIGSKIIKTASVNGVRESGPHAKDCLLDEESSQ